MHSTEDEDLHPERVPHGATYAGQLELMVELRGYADEGFDGRHMLGERLMALALHPTLTRKEMATASRLSEAEVDQIIRERWIYRQRCNQCAATDRVARHMAA
jgi:hypothetical protein